MTGEQAPQTEPVAPPSWKTDSFRPAPTPPKTPLPYSRPPVVLFAGLGLFLVLIAAAGVYLLLGSRTNLPGLALPLPVDSSQPIAPSPAQNSTIYSQAINTALDTRTKAEIDGIITAAQLFQAENGRFPENLDELISSQIVPQDQPESAPSGNQAPYSYELRENETNCVVKALLTTGEEYIRYCNAF